MGKVIAETKEQCKRAVLELWDKYVRATDPDARRSYGKCYVALKDVYVMLYGEEDRAMDQCQYCEAIVGDDNNVPAVSDEEAWAALGKEHEAWCEWIKTRAHRIEED